MSGNDGGVTDTLFLVKEIGLCILGSINFGPDRNVRTETKGLMRHQCNLMINSKRRGGKLKYGETILRRTKFNEKRRTTCREVGRFCPRFVMERY